MRSCLRRPLAPGRSRVRAIFVSSVMFFFFSSAIVIFTYGIFGIDRGDYASLISGARTFTCPSVFTRRTRQAPSLAGFSGKFIMQPDVAIPQAFPEARKLQLPAHQPCPPGRERHSSYPGCAYWACEICELPWTQAGTTYSGWSPA